MIAYIDESMRQGGDGLYVVTAAVIVKARSEDIRDAMRGLLLPGQRRLHWHDEGEERRHEILKVIGDMAAGSDLMACVYWHTPTPKPKQERARNLCLRAFLGELLNTAPTEVVIESRGGQDRRDRRTIARAIRAQEAPAALVYGHGRPLDEPLLWLPDAIAGAMAAEIAEEGRGYAPALERAVVVEKRVN